MASMGMAINTLATRKSQKCGLCFHQLGRHCLLLSTAMLRSTSSMLHRNKSCADK
jgi:hypothetical protein